jgi:hypothetical protein
VLLGEATVPAETARTSATASPEPSPATVAEDDVPVSAWFATAVPSGVVPSTPFQTVPPQTIADVPVRVTVTVPDAAFGATSRQNSVRAVLPLVLPALLSLATKVRPCAPNVTLDTDLALFSMLTPTSKSRSAPEPGTIVKVHVVAAVDTTPELLVTNTASGVAVAVGVAVFVGVFVRVGVCVGVLVRVGVAVLVGVFVLVDGTDVFVGVLVGVNVGTGVFVGDAVGVAVFVGVNVGTGVLVGVSVGTAVFVGVGVSVANGVLVAVAVSVGVDV